LSRFAARAAKMVASLEEKERRQELEGAKEHPNPGAVKVSLPDAVRLTEVEDETGGTPPPPVQQPTSVTVTVTQTPTVPAPAVTAPAPEPSGEVDPEPAQCARDLIERDDFTNGGDLGRWGQPDDPLTTARLIEARWRDAAGDRLIRHWRGGWWWYNGCSWEMAEDAHLRAYVYRRLEHASWLKPGRRGAMMPEQWKPNRNTVSGVLDALNAVMHTPSDVDQPNWLDGTETIDDTGVLVSLANCLLEPLTLTQRPHTPRYFVGFNLPFAYDPSAECPEWERFLESVFPGDDESKLLLREWFGYVISGRLDRHKMLFLIGAKRSGKGTITRTLRKLVGEVNCAAPTLSSLASNFGLASMIGRPLATIGDARLGKADTQLIIERLLMISGGDPIDVDRKNQAVWTGVLPTRIMMSSNETPWFRDASGAITSRMLVLELPTSFLGREDFELEDKLAAELPGIFNWALVGLRELEQHQQFVMPEASAEVVQDLEEVASPIKRFIETELVLETNASVSMDELMVKWVAWNGGDVKDGHGARTGFGKNLNSALREVFGRRVYVQRRQVDGARIPFYYGVTLRNKLPSFVTGAYVGSHD